MTDIFSSDCTEFEDLGGGVLCRWCADGRILFIRDNTQVVHNNPHDAAQAFIPALFECLNSLDTSQPVYVLIDVTAVKALDYSVPDRMRQFTASNAKDIAGGRTAVVVPANAIGRSISTAASFVMMVGWTDMENRVFTDVAEAYAWLQASL